MARRHLPIARVDYVAARRPITGPPFVLVAIRNAYEEPKRLEAHLVLTVEEAERLIIDLQAAIRVVNRQE